MAAPTLVLGNTGNQLRDLTQRTRAGQFIHDALHACCCSGVPSFCNAVKISTRLMESMPRSDFDARIQIQHLGRIAGTFRGHGAQFGDEIAAGRLAPLVRVRSR